MSEELCAPLRPALYERHIAAGAVLAVEDGWEMPRHYGDALGECRQVRQRAGVADISHQGRIRIRGDGAADLLAGACGADVARQEDDTARPAALVDAGGGAVEPVTLLRLEDYWLLMCSPGARPAVLGRLQARASEFGAKVDDQTIGTSMLTVIGPQAPAILDALLPEKVSALPAGTVRAGSMLIARYVAVRTDRLGLWELQVILPNMLVGRAWDFITRKAGQNAVPPVGLAALEALENGRDAGDAGDSRRNGKQG